MENEIGYKIKILRKTRGLTQQQLCEKLKVTRATISNYEIGRRKPSIKELEEISKVLGVSLEYFGVGGSLAVDLVARAKILFDNEEIDAAEKAATYKKILKMYLELEEK